MYWQWCWLLFELYWLVHLVSELRYLQLLNHYWLLFAVLEVPELVHLAAGSLYSTEASADRRLPPGMKRALCVLRPWDHCRLIEEDNFAVALFTRLPSCGQASVRLLLSSSVVTWLAPLIARTIISMLGSWC